MSEDAPRRPQVNWVQSLAASLAAVTSAVLLSTVGVAGTLIGAALGSLALTIGNAVYSHYIETTKERVAAAHAAATSRVARAQARVRYASRKTGGVGATQELAQANRDLDDARDELGDGQPGGGEGNAAGGAGDGPDGPDGQDGPLEAAAESVVRPRWRELLSGLPWKRIAIAASATFVVAMLIILAFELATGRAVSSYTGGSDPDRRTSIPGLGGGGAASDTDDDPSAPDGGAGDDTDGGTSDGGGTGGGTGSTDTGTGGTEEGVDEPTPTSTPEEDTETTVAPETTEETPAPAPSPEPVAPETEVPPPTD